MSIVGHKAPQPASCPSRIRAPSDDSSETDPGPVKYGGFDGFICSKTTSTASCAASLAACRGGSKPLQVWQGWPGVFGMLPRIQSGQVKGPCCVSLIITSLRCWGTPPLTRRRSFFLSTLGKCGGPRYPPILVERSGVEPLSPSHRPGALPIKLPTHGCWPRDSPPFTCPEARPMFQGTAYPGMRGVPVFAHWSVSSAPTSPGSPFGLVRLFFRHQQHPKATTSRGECHSGLIIDPIPASRCL